MVAAQVRTPKRMSRQSQIANSGCAVGIHNGDYTSIYMCYRPYETHGLGSKLHLIVKMNFVVFTNRVLN